MSDEQSKLQLLAPSKQTTNIPLIPAYMVKEYVYCPRLPYLMWRQNEWVDTADTVDGRRIHNRVDKKALNLPDPKEIELGAEKIRCQSVTLTSEILGVISKVDVVEIEDGHVIPVEYKRGKRPHIAYGASDPIRVQVCLQALLLEENRYSVKEGMIWYASSRERVRVELDASLRQLALESINQLRLSINSSQIPPPLQDSPKCPRCALVSVCLPDELSSINGSNLVPRPIAVSLDEALPLVVQAQRARISKEGETLVIAKEEDEDLSVRLNDVSDVSLFGNISITAPAMSALFEREIPITFHSHGGWFRGMAHGLGHRNVDIRTAQYRSSFDARFCLQFSQNLVAAKITNQRTMIRRNWRTGEDSRIEILQRLAESRNAAFHVKSLDKLLGVEGDAAATYFRAFSELLAISENSDSVSGADNNTLFNFRTRNRRPPTDPVNALLSLAYAMLTRHLTVILASVGLDPYRGFYHAPRYGRPALALDLMEPFRPIIADSVVLSAINTAEVTADDFIAAPTGTSLNTHGRRRFVSAFERRLSQETTHPIFGYRLSVRRLLILQARLLTRNLLNELPSYPHFIPR